jgi:hypothetical protein
LEKCCTLDIPGQSTLRKHYLPICHEETSENIRGKIGDAFIMVAMDEMTDSVGPFIANLVAGKLDIEVPSNSHFICSKFCTIQIIPFLQDLRMMDLRVLWPTGFYEEKVLILYLDAAAYILKAATALKVCYPNLNHFIMQAHELQHVADKVRAKFPQVNKLISMTNKCF